MREGSYVEIEKSMKVVGRDGQTLGGVTEVLADEASGIFHGLAVRPNLFSHDLEIPGEKVDRVSEGVVYVDALEAELQPYQTAAEKHQAAAEQHA